MTEAAKRSSIPSEQRIFSLVLALVVSPEGLSKRELLSSVYGYSDRFVRGETNEALDRQFERDKDQLRSLGIRVETLDAPLEPGNNQLTRYRIPKEGLEFPSDLRFSERELMLLRLAALAWSEGSLSAESLRATVKLEALGAGLDVQYLGVAPNLGTAEPAAEPLQNAIDGTRVVRFSYTLPTREVPLERRVAPLRLHRVEGRWHLIAWDLDRAADRVFLLSRISGEVTVTSRRFDAALRARAEEGVARLLALRDERRAVVRVRRGGVAEARLRARATTAEPTGSGFGASGFVELSLGVLDPHILAEELMGYGAEVEVLEPESLRDLVTGGLRRIAAAHGAAARDEAAAPTTAAPTGIAAAAGERSRA
ncbi:MAG: helix-turn-helix transcriptional regulator [Leucobacter sp.]